MKIDWNIPIQIDPEVAQQFGVVGWWPFIERGGDITRNYGKPIHHGSLVGSPSRSFDGQCGPAMTFGGNYVSVPNAAPFYPNSQTFSFGCWFRRTGASGATYDNLMRNRNVDSGGATNLYGLYVRPGTGEILAEARGSGSYSFALGGAHTLGKWHHAACVVASASPYITLYLDGVSVATSTTNPGTVNQNSAWPILFARHQSDSTQYFYGDIAQVFFSGKSLSENQIAFLARNRYALAWQPSPRKFFYSEQTAPASKLLLQMQQYHMSGGNL